MTAAAATPFDAPRAGGVCSPDNFVHGVQCNNALDLHNAGKMSTAAECCAACEKEKDCMTWTWDQGSDQDCWFKRGCATPTHDSNLVGGLSVASNCSMLAPGIDCNGDDLWNVQLDTAAECCALCSATPGCEHFTWDVYNPSQGRTPTCYLKYACESPSPCDQPTDCSSGRPAAPLPFCPPCEAAQCTAQPCAAASPFLCTAGQSKSGCADSAASWRNTPDCIACCDTTACPPAPPPSPPPPPWEKCHTINPKKADDKWCEDNCLATPPNCPHDICRCAAPPPPSPSPPPPPPPAPPPPPSSPPPPPAPPSSPPAPHGGGGDGAHTVPIAAVAGAVVGAAALCVALCVAVRRRRARAGLGWTILSSPRWLQARPPACLRDAL